jgi:UDP-N-acetyl-D-glucosamine dehydrogenase
VLEKKIKDKSTTIAVIGLGYVGLPLAVAFSKAGFNVVGIDTNRTKVAQINKGKSPIPYVKDSDLRIEATASQARLGEADIVLLCVPTPLTKQKQPDLSYIIKETKQIAKYMVKEQLIILESTTYPGTTREVMLPLLQRGGKRLGRDFFLAHAPERIDPGNTQYSLHTVPQVIGGLDRKSAVLARELYLHINPHIVVVSSAEVAEMTKVFENVFRNVNIALVNELLMLCHRMKLSVWEVLDAASTKPYGFMPFYPGLGPSGHCIPLDPYYLSAKAREYDFHTEFIEVATKINEQMPYYAADRIADTLNGLRGKEILVLGITYKRDIADTRESTSLKLIAILTERGAKVSIHDPFYPDRSVPLTPTMWNVNCVVIGTDHSSYNWQEIAKSARLVFDCRGVTRNITARNVVRL